MKWVLLGLCGTVLFAKAQNVITCTCMQSMEDVIVAPNTSDPDDVAYQKCGDYISNMLNRKGTSPDKIKEHEVFKNFSSESRLIYGCQATALKKVSVSELEDKRKTLFALKKTCNALMVKLMATETSFTDMLLRRYPAFLSTVDSHVKNCIPPL